MAWQGLKLNLRVAQKQILTPGLVQMVSVLALNRLELREMINQEMIANPVLEEQSEEPTQTDNYSDETFLKAETEKVPEKPEANPFDEFDVGTFFNQYLDTGGDGGQSQQRECLLRQLKAFDPQNTLAQQIVSEHLKQVQSNQLKEVARALNRPLEVVKRALDVIKKLDPRPGLRYNKTEPRLVEPDVYFRKVDDQWQAFLNEHDMPQLRLSPTYRRLLVRDAADRDVRNYVKERFTAAIQLMKNIE